MALKVAWVCACPGEADYDMLISCLSAGIECKIYALDTGWYFDKNPGINANNFCTIGHSDIANVDADLIILRYPQSSWALPKSLEKTIAWTSEQGPTKTEARNSVARFNKVAVNNKVDLNEYSATFTNKKIFYLPFGGRQNAYRKNNHYFGIYNSDIVCSTNPHYKCNCCNGLKRQSFDIMIRPLLNMKIDCFGIKNTDHGWDGVPDLNDKYTGWFEHWRYQDFLSMARVYVDTTFNWRDGGYGCKLARALANGIPIVWQRTVGCELDIPDPVVKWSSSPQETLEIVTYLLDHPKEAEELGDAGYQWFLKNWVWSDNIQRIANEL